MKYQSRPKIVEARQFDGTNLFTGMDWDMMGAFVTTIHGQKTYVSPLDYVITEPDGIHHYPCKPDIFKKSYEPYFIPVEAPKEVSNNLKNTTMTDVTAEKQTATRELTFGEKAIGITFNPGGHPEVEKIKRHYADTIDYLNDLKNATDNGEKKRLLSIAITESQSAQMFAVKAVTWQY